MSETKRSVLGGKILAKRKFFKFARVGRIKTGFRVEFKLGAVAIIVLGVKFKLSTCQVRTLHDGRSFIGAKFELGTNLITTGVAKFERANC